MKYGLWCSYAGIQLILREVKKNYRIIAHHYQKHTRLALKGTYVHFLMPAIYCKVNSSSFPIFRGNILIWGKISIKMPGIG